MEIICNGKRKSDLKKIKSEEGDCANITSYTENKNNTSNCLWCAKKILIYSRTGECNTALII